jgi:hypothetical protein
VLTACAAVAADARNAPPAPQEFLVERHTFFDFGPPFHFYELFAVRARSGGAFIERLTLTPAGDACLQPASVGVVNASVGESVFDLLGRQNPCAIPENELRRERKRCKHCLVFSGADVVMQVRCGDKTRRIRMDILDQDLFDPSPHPPEHTSWTMEVLKRLDEATGQGVMERPLFPVDEPTATGAPVESSLLEGVKRGEFDSLVAGAPHKLSDLYAESLKVPPAPSVVLLTPSPFRPVSASLPKYPGIARLAHLNGVVAFRLTVTDDGGIANLQWLNDTPVFSGDVATGLKQWRFPPEAAGRDFVGVIEFKMNCP